VEGIYVQRFCTYKVLLVHMTLDKILSNLYMTPDPFLSGHTSVTPKFGRDLLDLPCLVTRHA
jgi:hypothetical protein